MARRRGASVSVKITDVAAAAGVAPMTVSRVLNAPDRVSAATAQRVREAIERLGYVPNLIAGGLSSRRSRLVAAIVPGIDSPLFSVPLAAFATTMNLAGYHVLLGLADGAGEAAASGLLRGVLARRPDGLLLTDAAQPPAVVRLLHDAGVPVVTICDAAPAVAGMLVGLDHAALGAAVADFFADRGHTRFALMAGSDPPAVLRRQGFADRLARRGGRLVAEYALAGPGSIAEGRAGLRAMLPALEAPTALFCGADPAAFGAVTEARMQGIAMPARLAVCGFGDFALCRDSEPAVTSLSFDATAMGRMAAEALLARLAGAEAPARMLLPFHIAARATT